MGKNAGSYIFIFILILLTIGSGYNYFYQPFENWSASTPTIEPSPITIPIPIPETDDQIRAKLLQLIAVPIKIDSTNASLSAQLSWIETNNPGFVTLFGEKIATDSAKAVISAIKDRPSAQNQFPYSERANLSKLTYDDLIPFVAVDHEGGSVQRLSGSGFTKLPSWQKLCEETSAERKDILDTSANELSIADVDIVFAPVLDLATANPVMKDRICSDQLDITAQAAMEYANVFTSFGIVPVFKHFPGIGAITEDLHTATDSAFISYDQVIAFRRVLDIFPYAGVMTTHVLVENQSATTPCSLTKECVDQLDITYPKLVIFSDALDMESALATAGSESADLEKRIVPVAKNAIYAGNTVLVFGPVVSLAVIDSIVDNMLQEFRQSPDFARQVNSNMNKIIQLKTGIVNEDQ